MHKSVGIPQTGFPKNHVETVDPKREGVGVRPPVIPSNDLEIGNQTKGILLKRDEMVNVVPILDSISVVVDIEM